MNCEKGKHIYEYSTTHDFNPSDFQFPYGHYCKCNTKLFKEPKLNDKIQECSMIDKILISRIESATNQLVESRGRLLI